MDYSKWDKFEVSDSDSDEGNQSIVTDLGGPTSVNVNKGKDVTFTRIAPSSSSTSSRTVPVPVPLSAKAAVTASSSSAYVEKEGLLEFVRRENYCWRQSRDDVTLVIPMIDGVRAKDLIVSMACTNDKVNGNGIGRGTSPSPAPAPTRVLSVRIAKGAFLLQGTLQYPIVPQDIAECWEVVTSSPATSTATSMDTSGQQRQLEICLQKQSPIPGAVQWWTRVLEGEPQIDPATVPARLRLQAQFAPKQQQQENLGKGQQKQTFQDVWMEAHDVFRRRVQDGEVGQVGLPSSADTDMKAEIAASE